VDDSACITCHTSEETLATIDFPTSWIGHYPPDADHAPLVFFVRLFYLIFIPAVLGIMVVFVATDVRKRRQLRSKEIQHG
jgi:hypothetical protein